VIDDRGQEVLLMARVAGGGQSRKLPGGRVLVARITLDQGMRANQGEAVGVILNGLQRNLPPFHGVATGAIGAELAFVDVRVTIGALRTDVLENKTGVALHAAHFFMHAAQRIPG
jgi:hypothetical protein